MTISSSFLLTHTHKIKIVHFNKLYWNLSCKNSCFRLQFWQILQEFSLLSKSLTQCEKAKYEWGSTSCSITGGLSAPLFLFGPSDGIQGSHGSQEGQEALSTGGSCTGNCREKGVSFLSLPLGTVPCPQGQSHHKRNESPAGVWESGETESIFHIYFDWCTLAHRQDWDFNPNYKAALLPDLFLTNDAFLKKGYNDIM